MKRHKSTFLHQRSCWSRSSATRRAFTLIEILVVLSIAAIVTAITLGGFKEMTQGNKRVSCQTNLTQIYQACRLYAADEGGKFPFYSPNCGSAGPTADGIGLWALYTFPNATFDAPAAFGSKPIERYLRSAKSLHCPSDFNQSRTQLMSSATEYNLGYLSYQACDDNVSYRPPALPPLATATPTYQTKRSTDTANANWQRQLLHFNGSTFVARQPSDNTVITWCPFHRNSRDMDNVLFYDGSVQLLPRDQSGVSGWQRTPKPPA
jgi:prepilin-type N-terminal cleavage/methylation domain-containing protein